MISPITPAELLRLEANLCRSKHRIQWWTDARSDNPVGAMGRMLNEFLDARNAAARRTKEFRPLTQASLREHLKSQYDISLSLASLCDLLNGDASDTGQADEWGPLILRLILQGTPDPSPQAKPAIDRITSFFFPDGFTSDAPLHNDSDRNRTWYFHPSLRRMHMPATTREAVAEMLAMCHFCTGPRAGRGRIVRTSGEKRFLQVASNGQLTASGEATIECLKAGIDVVFIYPESPSPTQAEESVDDFYRLAKRALAANPAPLARLHRIALKPNELRDSPHGSPLWAGEYLSRTLRYVFHSCQAPAAAPWHSWQQLLISRDPKWGPCAYQTDENDIAAFQDWQSAFAHPTPVLAPL